MSRITKEEIEKTKCGRFLLSDENIYLSIYSLNSYVFEYNLLNITGYRTNLMQDLLME